VTINQGVADRRLRLPQDAVPVDEDERAADEAAGGEQRLGGQPEDQPQRLDLPVLIAVELTDECHGEQQRGAQHREQMNGRRGSRRGALRDVEPVEQPGQRRGQRECQATADREQRPMGHRFLLDAERTEHQHRHPDRIRADAGVCQRRMGGLAGPSFEQRDKSHTPRCSGLAARLSSARGRLFRDLPAG